MAKKTETVVVETPEALELKKLRDFIHQADEESGNDRLDAAPAADVAIAWIEELQREAGEMKANYDGACQTVAAMHAAAVGEVTGSKRGVVEDVEDLRKNYLEVQSKYDQLFEQWTDLHQRLNEQLSADASSLEAGEFVNSQRPDAEPDSLNAAYTQFVQVVDGDFPAWSDLPQETKALYLDSAVHVLQGGEPRTDFERVIAHWPGRGVR